jgi:hypothetical protein
MIRFSQLSALGLKYRGGKDLRAAIRLGTTAVNYQRDRRAIDHRQYATAPQGINVVYFSKCRIGRLKADKVSI